MNRFEKSSKNSHIFRRIASSAAILFCGIAALMCGISSVRENTDESYIKSLQLALQRSAVHCYAIEGRYPESLDYLQEHYAINWDSSQYVVDYEIVGANRMPVITVIALNQTLR